MDEDSWRYRVKLQLYKLNSAYGFVWKFAKDVTTIPEGSKKEDELPSEAIILEEIV